LLERQREFAKALLDPAATVPAGIIGPDGLATNKRFAVYRNNVVVGLIEALQANFPATFRLVGEDFFRVMARTYAAEEPPTSPILLGYGAGFPDFIDRFEPAESLPYLSDVARIERAWTEAYHAREARSLDASAFANLPHDQAPNIRFELHPSLRVVRSQFPALTIWRMNVADGVPGTVDLDAGGEDVLILRPAADVEVRSLPPGGAEFLLGLAARLSLGDASKRALLASSCFELATNLAALIDAGAFVEFSVAEDLRMEIGERDKTMLVGKYAP
jgi:hypothetical protein